MRIAPTPRQVMKNIPRGAKGKERKKEQNTLSTSQRLVQKRMPFPVPLKEITTRMSKEPVQIPVTLYASDREGITKVSCKMRQHHFIAVMMVGEPCLLSIRPSSPISMQEKDSRPRKERRHLK